MSPLRSKLVLVACCVMVVADSWPRSIANGAVASNGELEIRVIDAENDKPISARMSITRANGKPYRPTDSRYYHDHFLIDGKIILTMPVGTYNFQIERGIEYLDQAGHFTIERGATDTKIIRLKRYVDMRALGWWSGDLGIRRSDRDLESLMHAEDLSVGACWLSDVSTTKHKWQVSDEGFHYWLAGENMVVTPLLLDERMGGSLYAIGLAHDWKWEAQTTDNYPASVDFLKAVRKAGTSRRIAGEPFAWDLPIWIASQQVDALVLLGPFLHNAAAKGSEKGESTWAGRPRDRLRFRGADGMGRYCEDIYYQLLNCGLQIPPVAASGSGKAKVAAGNSRVYVHCGEQFDIDRWWQHLLEGLVLVTNGPILLPQVNGELPGHVFQGYPGETVRLKPTLTLHTRVKIAYLEIVKNGEVIHEVRLDQLRDRKGELPTVEFDRSGWLLLRAVAERGDVYQGGTCGPFYVRVGEEPRISRKAVQFFLDWLTERTEKLEVPDPEQREHVLRYHRAARSYWEKRLAAANDD